MSNGPAMCEKPPYRCVPMACDRVCHKYVIPDGGWGHTCSVAPNELPLFRRTQITPLGVDWTCQYCKCVNPAKNVHCEHCGAPHLETKSENQVQRIRDEDEFEPDEDGQSAIFL